MSSRRCARKTPLGVSMPRNDAASEGSELPSSSVIRLGQAPVIGYRELISRPDELLAIRPNTRLPTPAGEPERQNTRFAHLSIMG